MVAANAVTHGATSKQAFVKGENLAGYESHATKFGDEFKPLTVHEQFLVQRMADSAWRLQRGCKKDCVNDVFEKEDRRTSC
jgi:hypothetical protein